VYACTSACPHAYPHASPDQVCQPDEYCYNGYNFSCPPKATSGPGMQSYLDCSCRAGFMNTTVQTSDAMCQDCLQDHYCLGGGQIAPCTNNSFSPAQSKNSTSCTCNLGYMGVRNAPCVPCASPTYCYWGLLAYCPTGTVSGNLSWSVNNCTCNAGRYGMTGARGFVGLGMFTGLRMRLLVRGLLPPGCRGLAPLDVGARPGCRGLAPLDVGARPGDAGVCACRCLRSDCCRRKPCTCASHEARESHPEDF